MKFLIDHAPGRVIQLRDLYPEIVCGQLMTPLTKYADASMEFGIDNGAYSSFHHGRFRALLKRRGPVRERCKFVAVPDVVGNGRRTLEVFRHFEGLDDWPLALVLQDGVEDLDIPWQEIAAIFVGGTTHFKMSQAASDLVKAAGLLEKHIHVGRVNTPDRWKHFADLGAHTCDGSGASRYDWMIKEIYVYATEGEHLPLFDCNGSDQVPASG